MKKVREAHEARPPENAEGWKRQEDAPWREPWVTLADEEGHSRRAEVRRRATGARGRDKGDVESRAKGRATYVRCGTRDAMGPIHGPEGGQVFENGAQQDEEVTFSDGDARRPIASGPSPSAKGRTQDRVVGRRATKASPVCAKSSASIPLRGARSAKRSEVSAPPGVPRDEVTAGESRRTLRADARRGQPVHEAGRSSVARGIAVSFAPAAACRSAGTSRATLSFAGAPAPRARDGRS
jgi:hypothetical protein